MSAQSFLSGRVVLHAGDCREVLAALPDASVDAVVTDPPYHLASIVKRFGKAGAAPARSNGATGIYERASRGFMGQEWDGGTVAFDVATWEAVARVLKPGGHLAAFAAPKNAHRMVCAIEDAGFEIRDTLMWLFGSGFPKSLNVAKAIDKHLGVDGERIASGAEVRRIRPGADQHKVGWEKLDDRTYTPHDYMPGSGDAAKFDGYGTALKPAYEPIVLARKPLSEGSIAANVLAHGTGGLNIDGCRVEGLPKPFVGGTSRHGGQLGGAGVSTGRRSDWNGSDLGRWPANVVHDGSGEVVAAFPREAGAQRPVSGQEKSSVTSDVYGARGRVAGAFHGDSGSAARFFYTAKAGAEDRLGSKHPTVKPLALMRWLVRLVAPPGAVILDPFAGTGTTGAAAFCEGLSAVLIEREAAYRADIERRMALMLAGPEERRAALTEQAGHDGLPLFSGGAS
ncbi:site-specific DNA-methyltransferase [Afifella sp. H1R]|uniref:DNA methyltransferase n=1 Tax=Afifella sp. H1R TaxID=2908841 RepID=UPI001F31BAC4|nr:DNA methyltransferase [Afifella sp. H1R]MCF1502928.1 site-specific DNA-methyltransferase [Afifella sp. H1R]